MKDCGAKCYVSCVELTQEVSEKNISTLTGDCFCDILVKKVAAFCPCLKSQPEAKMKSFGIIPLSVEISIQPSIDSVIG